MGADPAEETLTIVVLDFSAVVEPVDAVGFFYKETPSSVLIGQDIRFSREAARASRSSFMSQRQAGRAQWQRFIDLLPARGTEWIPFVCRRDWNASFLLMLL